MVENYTNFNEYSGKGVRVAVIDSGLDENSDLSIKSNHLFNFTTSNTVFDENGHGTMMINIISNKNFGIAPDAEIFSLKVLNENCEGNYLDTIKAIQWCIDNNIQIINLSVSTTTNYPQLNDIIDKANKSGILIFSSLCNSYSEENYPADYENVFGIYTDYKMYKEGTYKIFCPFNEFYINEVEGCKK